MATQNDKSCEHIMMLKQGVKRINAEFIWTRGLFQLSFVQFRPYAKLFVGLLLSLTLMSKSKKTLVMSLDLMPLFKASIDCWLKGSRVLFRMLIIWKISAVISFKTNIAEKDIWCAQNVLFFGLQFSFCMDFFDRWWFLKVKNKE